MTKQPPQAIDPRQVEYLPLDRLEADPRNPKAHHLETIDESIGRFGMLDLIVRDGRTGYIVSGHGRRKALSAMQDRGESAPEGVKVDPDTGGWLVPVVTGWASRTDSEAAAALIALNRTTELGGWVDDALLGLLDDLSQDEGGLVGVGYEETDVEALRALAEHLDSAGDPAPRDLDELHASVGDPTDEDALERVVLTLDADLAARLRERVGSTPEEHATAVADWLGE